MFGAWWLAGALDSNRRHGMVRGNVGALGYAPHLLQEQSWGSSRNMVMLPSAPYSFWPFGSKQSCSWISRLFMYVSLQQLHSCDHCLERKRLLRPFSTCYF